MSASNHIAPPVSTLLRDLKAALADLYGDRLHAVVLYGSHARGEATADSDIDVLVVLKDDVDLREELSRMADVALQQELAHDVWITLFPVSNIRFRSSSTPFLNTVRREGQRL